jgi:hypothetical protein
LSSKAIPNVPSLQTSVEARYFTISTFQWLGRNNDVIQVVSTPVFLLAQAVDSMSRVEDMGEEVKAGEKKNFILDVVGTVLFFVPLVGEFAELADTVTALVQIINLIGEVGSAALSVASMIEDPSSASIDIMGFILGGSKNCSDPAKFATRAGSRRDMV